MELRTKYGGTGVDPELIPAPPADDLETGQPAWLTSATRLQIDGWPQEPEVARQNQKRLGRRHRIVDLGNGVGLQLVQIPAGPFVMGDVDGAADEHPQVVVTIDQPFWIGSGEVSNEQFRQFDSNHRSGYYVKRHARGDDKGLSLDGPRQPVVRVAWQRAMDFCHWLSERTDLEFSLPTEAQWEYACRAGSDTPLFYGQLESDFSSWANVADQSFSRGLMDVRSKFHPAGVTQVTGGVPHLLLEGAKLSDARFSDGAVVTTPTASYQPNPWGLYDMHGNAAEWTRSSYTMSPCAEAVENSVLATSGRKTVRGGSFFDRPDRCRSSFRLSYPVWQRVFNVGFRVVAKEKPDG
jgi:formylglycine-generating enzyme required for sulfatase activity